MSSIPLDLQIWVSERKPKTSEEAEKLADDYNHAGLLAQPRWDVKAGGDEA